MCSFPACLDKSFVCADSSLRGRKFFLLRADDANRPCRFKLKGFQKFDSAATAVEEAAAIIEGKVTPRLASLLDGIKDEKKGTLAVADAKLGMYN